MFSITIERIFKHGNKQREREGEEHIRCVLSLSLREVKKQRTHRIPVFFDVLGLPIQDARCQGD